MSQMPRTLKSRTRFLTIHLEATGTPTASQVKIVTSGTGPTVVTITSAAGVSIPVASVTAASAASQLPVIANTAATTVTSAAQYDVSGWTGLATFNGTSVGGENVKAAATTAISATDSALGAGSITTTGGSSVTISATGTTTGSITVGSATASAQPTGAVSVTSSVTSQAASVTAGAIQVNGGTNVTVTQSVVDTNANHNNTVTQGAVTVNGAAATTTVTVNQSSTAAATTAATAAAGTPAVSAVTAAPGVQGVSAVTGVTYVKAVAEGSAIAGGQVQIVDVNGSSSTAAGTITTVSLAGYGASSSITANSLQTLNLSGANAAGSTLTVTDNLSSHVSTNTLTLNTNAYTTTGTIVYSKLGTLTVSNTGTTTFGGVNAANLKGLTVSGTGSYTQTINSTLNAGLKTLTIGGSVNFSDNTAGGANGLATLGAALTIANTSSGTFSATLDGTTQTYNGSGAGAATIYLGADATKSIVGSSSANDELVLTATGASAYTFANTGTNVTGFEILGIAGSINNGTLDVTQVGSGFNQIDVRSTGTVTLTKVAQNSAVTFRSSTSALNVNYADTAGATDNVTVTIGTATNGSALTVGQLTLQDKNGVGVGTLNIVTNNTVQSGGANDRLGENVITTLVDSAVSTINVTGSGDLAITNLNPTSAALTLNSNSTGTLGLTVGTLTDNSLTSLTAGGANATYIGTLNDSGATLSITNAGTGAFTINAGTLGSAGVAQTLTLGAGVTFGGNGTAGSNGVALSSTAGITVNGSADNNHVNLALGAAAAGKTNTVTLGNGNNSVVDNTLAGTVSVSVGTGSDYVKFVGVKGASTTTGSYTVNLAADSAVDYVVVGNAGTTAVTAANAGTPNVVINGAATSDRVYFGNDGASANTIAQVATAVSLTQTLADLLAATDLAHEVNYATFGGNTYVAERLGANGTAGDEITLVQITGVHTFTAAAGYVALAS